MEMACLHNPEAEVCQKPMVPYYTLVEYHAEYTRKLNRLARTRGVERARLKHRIAELESRLLLLKGGK